MFHMLASTINMGATSAAKCVGISCGDVGQQCQQMRQEWHWQHRQQQREDAEEEDSACSLRQVREVIGDCRPEPVSDNEPGSPEPFRCVTDFMPPCRLAPAAPAANSASDFG